VKGAWRKSSLIILRFVACLVLAGCAGFTATAPSRNPAAISEPAQTSAPTAGVLPEGARAFRDFDVAHDWEEGNGNIEGLLATAKEAGALVWLAPGTKVQILDHRTENASGTCLSCVSWTRIRAADGDEWWVLSSSIETSP
jgi:hypothetical protein